MGNSSPRILVQGVGLQRLCALFLLQILKQLKGGTWESGLWGHSEDLLALSWLWGLR